MALSTSTHPTLSALAFLAAGLLTGLAHPLWSQEPPAAEPGADYLFMDSASREKAVQVLPGRAFGDGERVSYTAFNGRVWELTRFQGRYVAILLPDSWMGPAALSAEQIRSFVDRSDLVYQQLKDWEGTEPDGEGALNIAVIPDTCGWGCGLIGSKGLEIADIPSLNPTLWADITAGKGVSVLIHEMTHNFDVFWPYLYYLPGHPHAWTDFVNLYYFSYTREGQTGSTPEEVARDWLATTAPYFNDRTATWERCVRDGQCEARGITANNAWGGLGFRLALFYGPRSARGFMTFLRDYRQTHQPPATTEGKNDLYVEALAAGAGRNLSCAADAWRWQISKGLRQRMKQLYGKDNPDCADLDRDGFSPLTGDDDDRRATVHPGAAELANGVDDDCDGRIDEAVWNEPAGGDFADPRKIAAPSEISGRIADTGDADTFLLRKPGRRVRFELCSHPDFQGWLFLYDALGVNRGFEFVSKGQCIRGAWNVGAGWWRFDVVLNAASSPGGYTVDVYPTAPWPAPPWARTAPARAEGNRLVLTASVIAPEALPSRPTAVRFWVSGQGIVGSVPYTPSAAFAWTPPAGVDPAGLTYRAQLVGRGVPLFDFTEAQAMVSP